MTFTLLARCPKSGQVGIGIATYSICVGLYCNGLRGKTGATMSQAEFVASLPKKSET